MHAYDALMELMRTVLGCASLNHDSEAYADVNKFNNFLLVMDLPPLRASVQRQAGDHRAALRRCAQERSIQSLQEHAKSRGDQSLYLQYQTRILSTITVLTQADQDVCFAKLGELVDAIA